MFLTFIFIIASFSAFADRWKFCRVNKQTISKVEKLRKSNMAYNLVALRIVTALGEDDCLHSRLKHQEMYTLADYLIENRGEYAASIIQDFLDP